MARTLEPEAAQRFADSQEIGSPNTAGARLMDLWPGGGEEDRKRL